MQHALRPDEHIVHVRLLPNDANWRPTFAERANQFVCARNLAFVQRTVAEHGEIVERERGDRIGTACPAKPIGHGLFAENLLYRRVKCWFVHHIPLIHLPRKRCHHLVNMHIDALRQGVALLCAYQFLHFRRQA